MPDVVSTRLELEDGISVSRLEIGLINRYCVPRACREYLFKKEPEVHANT